MPDLNRSQGFAASGLVAQLFLDTEHAKRIVAERCGEDARLVIGGPDLKIIEPVIWGSGPGNLTTWLYADKIAHSLYFNVGFKAVDDLYAVPICEPQPTRLPVDLDLSDAIVALSAIHETARTHLGRPEFLDTMQVMASLDGAAVQKLKG